MKYSYCAPVLAHNRNKVVTLSNEWSTSVECKNLDEAIGLIHWLARCHFGIKGSEIKEVIFEAAIKEIK